MPRFLNPRPQQNRLQQTAMPQSMGSAQQAPSMSQGPQQAGIMQQMRAQQAPSMSQGPQQKIDYAAQNAAGLGKLGNYGPPPSLPAQMGPQQGAPLGAGAGFGAPPTGPQQGMPQPMGGMSAGLGAPMQTQSNMSAAPPGNAPQGMPPTVSGGQAKSMGLGMKKGGKVKSSSYKSGGNVSTVSSVSKRGDGIAQRGKTRGKMC